MPLCPAPLHLPPPLLLMEEQPAQPFHCVTDENPFHTPSSQCHWLPFLSPFFLIPYTKVIVGPVLGEGGKRVRTITEEAKNRRRERKSTHVQ